ncbi:MAG TPA: hypothetical protein PLK82_09550, partial [Bacteroidales bacterium]|nr:hypothetical protein [Bacteroidales bacterium]
MHNQLATVIVIYGLAGSVFGQTALRQPEALTRAEKRISVNCLLGKSGNQLVRPWMVFSDREKNECRIGEKFFVIEERETELHVVKASDCRDRKLTG